MVNGILEKTKGTLSHGAIESLVPDVPMRSVPAHEGGCYTLAFDRCIHVVAFNSSLDVVRSQCCTFAAIWQQFCSARMHPTPAWLVFALKGHATE